MRNSTGYWAGKYIKRSRGENYGYNQGVPGYQAERGAGRAHCGTAL